jgi:hypothetical protein
MKIFLISSAALALTLVSAPASAQLLGGGGGLSGGLGGQIGGGLGSGLGSGLGNPISRPELPRLPDRVDRKMDGSGQGVLSTKGKRRVDTKSGDVSASRSIDGSLTKTLNTSGNAFDANGAGSAQGSANGSANAQLIGTDAVRSTAGRVTGTARDRAAMTRNTALTTAASARDRATMAAGDARDRATGLVGTAKDRATSSVSNLRNATGTLAGSATGAASGAAAMRNNMASGSADGASNGSASGGFGNLVVAGTGAANGQGMFAVMPGMPVTDAKGRVVGTVQSVATTSRGRIQQVRMTVGDKVASLPASNFSGQGDVLVSAMGKGELKKAAKANAAPH